MKNYVQIAKKNTTTDYLIEDTNHINPANKRILKTFVDAKAIRESEFHSHFTFISKS